MINEKAMLEFEKNKMRPEEKLGGFEPGKSEDETFRLDALDKYPGSLPDYAILESEETVSLVKQLNMEDQMPEPEPIPEEAPESVDDKPEAESGSVWDLFEQPSTDLESIDTKDDNAEIAKPKDTDMMKEIDFSKDEAPFRFDQDSGDMEEIKIDDDLLSIIQKEVDRSNQRKNKTEFNEIDPLIPESQDSEDKEAFDGMNGAKEIDLSAIEAEHPSTYNVDDLDNLDENTEESAETQPPAEEPKKSEDMKEPEIKPIKDLKVKETKPKEKKTKEPKQRKPIPWKKILTRAAAILIALLIIIGGYYLLFYSNGPRFFNTIKNIDISSLFKSEEHKGRDTLSKIIVKKAEPAKLKPKTIAPKPKVQVPVTPKKIETAPVIETTPKTDIIKKKKDYTYIPKKVEKPLVTTSKPEKRLEPPTENETKLYTVQVYASPSKEDAEEWLKQLRKLNIKDAFISTQKLRDKIWYRVRFGSFTSEQDARDAALKHNFPQTWIDRVR